MSDPMTNEEVAAELTANIPSAVAALIGVPDPRIENTPKGPFDEDGEQPEWTPFDPEIGGEP